MSLVNVLISSTITNAYEIICCYRIINKKLNFKNFTLYLSYFLLVLLISLNYMFINNLYKVILTIIIMFIVISMLFRMNIKNSIVLTFIMELIVIFSDGIFAVVINLLQNLDNQVFIESYQGQIISNLIIGIIMTIISFTGMPSLIYKKMIKFIDTVSVYKIIISFSVIIICSSFLFYISYYNSNSAFTLIVNFLIITIYLIIILIVIMKERKYNIIYIKYINTLDELEEYENIINEYRVINHENKNQLNCIKGMTNNKKVHSYINEIMQNKQSENKEILNQALLIPTGGLRGLLYSKMVVMKNKNISYRLYVDKKINSKLIKNISSKTILDICQIIGVFIDNAIEAVENCDNKMIIVNIYKLDDIVIEIINNFTEEFDINKIDKLGYTTKDGMHGYGLSLVNKILKANSDLLNERTIKDKMFKQKLIIKK